jgi:bifunctional non-homologous end joining protein LigD
MACRRAPLVAERPSLLPSALANRRSLIARPPDKDGCTKHDGFRILAWKRGERVRVWSRRGADFTDRFQRIADAVRGLNVDEALIDGEAVVFQDDGRSDLHALLTKRG